MSDEKLYEVKVIKNGGAKHHLIRHQGKEHFIHHKWDGPAIEPIEKGGKFSKKQYFLEGIEYTPEDYNDIMKNREGLPWYKQASPKGVTNRN